MKSFRYKWLIIIFLLFAIALMCGCTSIGNNNQTQPANTNLSSLVNHTVVYQNWSFYPLNMCPIPTLIFNNSQEIINLNSVISIANPVNFPILTNIHSRGVQLFIILRVISQEFLIQLANDFSLLTIQKIRLQLNILVYQFEMWNMVTLKIILLITQTRATILNHASAYFYLWTRFRCSASSASPVRSETIFQKISLGCKFILVREKQDFRYTVFTCFLIHIFWDGFCWFVWTYQKWYRRNQSILTILKGPDNANRTLILIIKGWHTEIKVAMERT